LTAAFYAGCGVTTGVGAAVFQAKVETGAKVIVFGLGGIGLNVLQGARLQQASMIIGVDTNPAREEIARKMGATHFVNPKAIDGDLVEHLRVLTGGGGDYTFECVGITSLMKQASDAAHPLWGVLTFVGAAPIQDMVCASPFDFLGGRKWQGTLFGGAKGKTDTPKIIDWYLDGKIDIDSLVTHEIALEDINEGFEMMKRGESIRTVITLD
jgi:S-(hydroxymethyl)glutathione dehydrogenase/alcohol dehydrogenase